MYREKARLISASQFRDLLGSFPVARVPASGASASRVLVGQSLEKFTASRLVGVPTHVVDVLLKDGGSTFEGTRKVSLVKIPKEASRQNSPSRPDMILKSLKPLAEKDNVEIDLCLRNETEVLPAAMAVYRACPLVSYKSNKKTERKIGMTILIDKDGQVTECDQKLIDKVEIVGEQVRMAQALMDLPPNELNPDTFRDIVLDMVAGNEEIQVKVLDDCQERGFMGLHSVGKGSLHKPRMIILTHTLDDGMIASKTESVALVGKGICFDSGGYSLKGSQFQIGMKRDMGGAAAALGAFMSLVNMTSNITRPKTIHCILCIAENMIGSNAFRNDDILHLYSGKSVEINNTDAEGRLILADGLAYAHKDLGAEVMIDIATLTGAASIASGKSHACIFSLNEDLVAKTVDAGKISGDLVHELVFCPELHREGLKSSIADMKNVTGKGSDAASSVAATFLYDNLVGSGFKSDKWLHVDMASVAENGERSTGYGVALLSSLVQSL